MMQRIYERRDGELTITQPGDAPRHWLRSLGPEGTIQSAVGLFDATAEEGYWLLQTGQQLDLESLGISPNQDVWLRTSTGIARRQPPDYERRLGRIPHSPFIGPWMGEASWPDVEIEDEIPILQRRSWDGVESEVALEVGEGIGGLQNDRIMDDQGVFYQNLDDAGLLAVQMDALPAPRTMCIDLGCNPHRDNRIHE